MFIKLSFEKREVERLHSVALTHEDPRCPLKGFSPKPEQNLNTVKLCSKTSAFSKKTSSFLCGSDIMNALQNII